jgi:hypothetical protein
LGLARTEDEPSRIARLAYLLACGVLALTGGLVYFRLPSGFRGKKAAAACAVLCAAAGLVFLYRFVEREMPGSPRSGVLKETALYRVPDPRGAVLARLGEGRPARLSFVPGKNGPWVRVSIRDEDGAAGWVPADRVVFY